MREIYGVLINLIVYSAGLNFYGRLKGEKLTKGKICIITVINAVCRFLLPSFIVTTIQLIISFVLTGVFLKLLERKVSWLLLTTSFLMMHTLDVFATLLSMLLSVVTFTILGIRNAQYLSRVGENSIFLLTIVTTALVLYMLIFLDEKKKINLALYAQHLKTNLVRNIIFMLGFLVIMLQAFLFTDLVINPTRTLAFIFWAVTSILVLIIIFSVIFLIRHLNIESRKQLELEQENKRLASEHEAIELQLLDFREVHDRLEQEYGVVTSNHHAYKYIVPTLMRMQQDFIMELDKFADYSHTGKLSRIRNYADQIRLLSTQINSEFAIDHIKVALNKLNIPDNWKALRFLFQELMQVALDKKVYLSIHNYDAPLEDLDDFARVAYIRLLSNIADNAIKESCKVNATDRDEVKITLFAENGRNGFGVQDGAEEFEISILKKLGQRKNSTNGTGDGYAEIFNYLKETKASLIIKEQRLNNINIKSISVVFDDCHTHFIDSHYRFYVLMKELAETEFLVMDMHR